MYIPKCGSTDGNRHFCAGELLRSARIIELGVSLCKKLNELLTPPGLIVFPKRMAAQAPIPPPQPNPPQQGFHAPTHGNWAQWAAILVALVIPFILRHFDRTASQDAENFALRVDKRIDDKLGPSVDKINDHIDKKVDPLSQKIDALTERVARLEGPLTRRVDILEKSSKQQLSLARLIDPARVLATIRAEIQIAESKGKALPVSDLVDYKNAVQALPASSREYWTTIAAIINYQSLINQMSGEAPDPAKVSKPCGGITGGTGSNNVIVGASISHCVVDLDSTHDALWNVVIKDSVIRYHGGPVNISAVFVNCTFVLDLPPNKTPAQPAILYALLDSPDQRTVRVSTPR